METIYVALINEGTRAWRRVDAMQNPDKTFTISLNQAIPEDEQWDFLPGEMVQCKQNSSAGEYLLAAFELAKNQDSLTYTVDDV